MAHKAYNTTYQVISALILRESLSRLFANRGAWFWLIAEPVVHIAFMMVLFTFVRMTNVGGIDTATWLVLGMTGFFLFKRTSTQVSNALDANQSLFTYRQVKPVDSMIARGILEGYIMIWVIVVMIVILWIMNDLLPPSDSITLLITLTLLWVLGLGLGIIIAVLSRLTPEIGKFMNLIMTPLYLMSGVIFPLQLVPEPYQSYLMLNPVAQGIESLRASYAHYYHAVPSLDLSYLTCWTLILLTFGLSLQHQFKNKLVDKR